MPLQKLLKYLPLVYLTGLVAISFIPFGDASRSMNEVFVLSLRLDYLLHALVFVPLYPLWKIRWPRHHGMMVLFWGILIAVALEASHYLIPYRAFNINDMVANAAGVLAGYGLFWLLKKWYPIRIN